jgi:hypothetical protein
VAIVAMMMSKATRIDVLRPMPETVTTPIAADRRAICICSDGDFRGQYEKKY